MGLSRRVKNLRRPHGTEPPSAGIADDDDVQTNSVVAMVPPVEGGEVQDDSRPTRLLTPARSGIAIMVVVFLAMGSIAGWMALRVQHAQQAAHQRDQFLQIARQEALNLTTIDWQHADSDVQRIVDAATGRFHDDFADRSGPFVEAVKQAKSKSVGTITAAGVESAAGNEAQVLVAVGVKTTTDGQPSVEPHAWRMRISLQRVAGDVKVSRVEFVE